MGSKTRKYGFCFKVLVSFSFMKKTQVGFTVFSGNGKESFLRLEQGPSLLIESIREN